MESVIYDGSPLADYLEGEGEGDSRWAPQQEHAVEHDMDQPEPSFAPRGKPTIPLKFRQKLPPSLRLTVPQNTAAAAIHNACSKAVNSRLGRADNEKFLERFRYIIVASQLLSTNSFLSQGPHGHSRPELMALPTAPQAGSLTLTGAISTAAGAFALAWLVHWARGGANNSILGKGRVLVVITFMMILAVVSYTHMRRQWLQYLRQQTLAETSEFISNAQGFDEVASAALTLVQEVELVSRGYRITPLPPISRLEDRSQTRRCARLRKMLRLSFVDMLPRYKQAFAILQPYTEPMDLEKYYDVYDISDLDFSEAMIDYSDTEFEDIDSLRVLKILAARLHTLRKVFLSCLLALDAHGGKPDFVRWSTAVDEVHAMSLVTGKAEERLRSILNEEETFPVPPTPKLPLSPGRERWRAQLRKLNSLSTGIRGLQAKLHVLREESDKNLNDTNDVSELGTSLMIQYESIGIDLKALMQEWEDGKAALASNIDRNERRISSMSGMLSPTISLSGLTAVDEGGALDALRALNGEDRRSRSSLDFSSSDAEEVFEAVALPRQRSTLTREQRITKMKEDRAKRESQKDRIDANTHMLRELESVINLRPRGRTTPAGRITSI